MLNQLICKQLSWNRETADAFHKYAFIDTIDEGETLWENTDNGIFIWRYKTAHFFHNDGTVFKISRYWNQYDWDLHCKLYESITRKGDCRIEKPIYNEIINDYRGNWSYTVVKRPNNEIGNDLFEDIINNKIDTTYFLNVVSEITKLILHLKAMSDVFPNIMPKLANDSVGFFFTDIKEWTLNPEIFISNCITRIYRTIIIFERMYNINLNKKQIMEKVTKEWVF